MDASRSSFLRPVDIFGDIAVFTDVVSGNRRRPDDVEAGRLTPQPFRI
jgi:hypothetical protein